MRITSLQLRDAKAETRLEAVASITLDNMIVIHDIKIINNGSGYFLAMPSRKMPGGNFRDVAHPISKEARAAMEGILVYALEVMRENNIDFIILNENPNNDSFCLTQQHPEDFIVATAV